MASEGDADGEWVEPSVFDDDSAGPLAELLFSSPINGAFTGPENDHNGQAEPSSPLGSPNGDRNGGFPSGAPANGTSGNGTNGNGQSEGEADGDPDGHSGQAADPQAPQRRGRHDVDAIAPPEFPGEHGHNLVQGPDANLSTVQPQDDNADDFADELAALFLPFEPNVPVRPEPTPRPIPPLGLQQTGGPDKTIAGQPVPKRIELDPGAFPSGDRPVEKSTLYSDVPPNGQTPAPLTTSAPVVSAAPVQLEPPVDPPVEHAPAPTRIEPVARSSASPGIANGHLDATATTSLGNVAGELKYSTEAGPQPQPQGLQRSTVVHEPSSSVGGSAPPQLHDRSLFIDDSSSGMGGPLRFDATSGGSMSRARGGLISDSLLAATERRWFWGAVAGAVTLSCLVVVAAIIGTRGDGESVDADAALATVDAGEGEGAFQPSAGLSDGQQETAVSAQLPPTTRPLPPPPPPGAPARPRPTVPGAGPAPIDPTTGTTAAGTTETTQDPSTTDPDPTDPDPTDPDPTDPTTTDPDPTDPDPTDPDPTDPTTTDPDPTDPDPTDPDPTDPDPTDPDPTDPDPTDPDPTDPDPTDPDPTDPDPTDPDPTDPDPTDPDPPGSNTP